MGRGGSAGVYRKWSNFSRDGGTLAGRQVRSFLQVLDPPRILFPPILRPEGALGPPRNAADDRGPHTHRAERRGSCVSVRRRGAAMGGGRFLILLYLRLGMAANGCAGAKYVFPF